MRPSVRLGIPLGAVLALLWAHSVRADSTLVLKKAWVEKYKDRGTIEADLLVDDTHKKPNRPEADADLHCAGRSKQVGLALVAEIMNAAGQTPSVKALQDAKGTDTPVPVIGAWRLWFEHPPHDNGTQKQSFTLPKGKTGTNPDHVFEIHPLTKVDVVGIGDSLVPIDKKFATKQADDAFGRYEKLTATVSANQSSLIIRASMIGFNYAEFEFRALGAPKKLKGDGAKVVLGDVMGKDGEAIARGVRMVFLPNTRPLSIITANDIGAGDEIHVLGIPRVNLNAVYEFAYSSANDGKKRLLPYEMIIVAIYE